MGSCASKPTLPEGGNGARARAAPKQQQQLAAAATAAAGDGDGAAALAAAVRSLERRLAAAEQELGELRGQRQQQQLVAAAANGGGAAAPTASQLAAAAGAAAPPPAERSALSAIPVPPAPPSAAPPPPAVPMDATRVVLHQIVAPSECSALGICTGGQVLSWIDVCAGLSAKTLARGPCVTVSVDAVHFIRPCRLGQVVVVAAMVNRTFASSMEVGVRVEAEDMRTGLRHHCCSAYLTFVSLRSRGRGGGGGGGGGAGGGAVEAPGGGGGGGGAGDGGGGAAVAAAAAAPPRPLPRIVPAGPEQRAIYDAAEARRQARLARRRSLGADPEKAAQAERARLRPVTHREGCPTLPPPLTLAAAHERRRGGGGGGSGDDGGDAKPRVSPAATTAYATHSIMPQHANTLGITFGGQVRGGADWLDWGSRGFEMHCVGLAPQRRPCLSASTAPGP